jgi:hypothetical protein
LSKTPSEILRRENGINQMNTHRLIVSTIFLTVLSKNVQAQSVAETAQNSIAKCAAINYIATATSIDPEVIKKIPDFDKDTRDAMYKGQSELKAFGNFSQGRTQIFQRLYSDLALDQNPSNEQLQRAFEPHLNNYKISIKTDNLFAFKLASEHARCELYITKLSELVAASPKALDKQRLTFYIWSQSKTQIDPKEEILGYLWIAGLHWKHDGFVTWQSLKDALDQKLK